MIILCVSQPNVDDKLLSNGIYKRLPSAKSKWKLLSNGIYKRWPSAKSKWKYRYLHIETLNPA